MINLEIEITGIKLRNPLILASCSLGSTSRGLIHFAESGLGAVVSKTITTNERQGFGGTRYAYIKTGMLNAEGLPNMGSEKFPEEIKDYFDYWEKKGETPIPLIVSISDLEDTKNIPIIAENMEDFGANGLEINVSCPHSDPTKKDVTYLIGQNPDLVEKVTREVKIRTNIPVWVKLTPYTHQIVQIAQAAENGGADAISLINTLPGMIFNTDKSEEGKPILSNIQGGYSGEGVLPHALYCVYTVSKAVKIPVIGIGGISNLDSMLQHFFAGASAVQIATSFYDTTSYKIVPSLVNSLISYMEHHELSRISDLVGLSHKYEKHFDNKGILVGTRKIE